MLTNAVSDHYHNADGIEEKKNSTGQIIIGHYCNIVENECSKITDAKLLFFQAYMYNRMLKKQNTHNYHELVVLITSCLENV